MGCPIFRCKDENCHRAHECNRGDPHTEGHIEYEVRIDRPVRQPGTYRPSAVIVRAYW